MDCEYPHEPFTSDCRVSQSLCNDRCQNILYKAVFEHFDEITNIAALLLSSKSFQNSSFGANFLLNFVADEDSVELLDAVLSPSSCFSLQFVPSLHIKRWVHYAESVNRGISNFVAELVSAKYFYLSLRSLTLDSVTNEVLSPFFRRANNSWSQLQYLTLKNCELSDDSLLAIISISAVQLRTVNFSGNSGLTDVDFEHLSQLTGLTLLDLSYCEQITDAGLESISKLTNITSLDIRTCDDVTDAGLEHLSSLSNITSLNIARCCKITDVGLENISKLSDIATLDLSYCNSITDDGLEHISKLFRITFLDLSWCNEITDAGIAHISKLSGITYLNLIACGKITDAGFQHVSELFGITSLNLRACHKITDIGLAHLSKLGGITFLDLTWCNEITDAGLEHVAKLTRITSLDLIGCGSITSEARKKLQTALRNSHIIG